MKNHRIKVGGYLRLTRHDSIPGHEGFYGHHVGDVGVVAVINIKDEPEVVVEGRESTSAVARPGHNAVSWNNQAEFEVLTPGEVAFWKMASGKPKTTSTDDPIPVNEDLVREQTSLADDIFARLRSQYIL
jgi:hypothetical protein